MTTSATLPAGAAPRHVHGTSHWHGGFRDGGGTLSTGGDTLRDVPYSYASRFDGSAGACPEELLAAAHAGCINHALANIAGLAGVTFTGIETTVTVTMGRDDSGPAVLAVHVEITAAATRIDADDFQPLTGRAVENCAISKALTVRPTVSATLTPAP